MMDQKFIDRVMGELGAKVGSLELENACLKVKLEQAIATAEALAKENMELKKEDAVDGNNSENES